VCVREEVEGNKRFARIQWGLEVVELLSFDVEKSLRFLVLGELFENDV
jgi:hypothetical protein